MKDLKVDFLREKNENMVLEFLREKGKFALFSEYSPFLDKRTYFKVDEFGNVSEKTYNPLPLIFAFCDDEEKISKYFFKNTYPEEKQNIKKIDRETNLSLEELKKNLMKTLVNMNLDFSKVFAKELFLRDKKAFFEVLYSFALMGNPNNLKLFFVYALEKIFSKIEYDENIFYVFIAYLTKARDDYSTYIESEKLETLEIKKYTDDKEIYIRVFEEVVNKYDLKNKAKFRLSLYNHFKKDFKIDEDLKTILMEN